MYLISISPYVISRIPKCPSHADLSKEPISLSHFTKNDPIFCCQNLFMVVYGIVDLSQGDYLGAYCNM